MLLLSIGFTLWHNKQAPLIDLNVRVVFLIFNTTQVLIRLLSSLNNRGILYWNRTSGLQLRRLSLYPTELTGHIKSPRVPIHTRASFVRIQSKQRIHLMQN